MSQETAQTDPLRRLQDLFRELFQLDLADLDFGIYRLLHLKRADIEAFLTKQLPAAVDREFRAAAGAEQAAVEAEVKALAARIREEVSDEAISPDGDPAPAFAKVKLVEQYAGKRRQLAVVQATDAQKADVFNHLYAFFARYYDAGDFIPRRFYGSRESYAVPYNGEEVLFHWANRDQHYVKTGEVFRDYSFRIETLLGKHTVRFKLAEASTAKDNTKGDVRFFFPFPKHATHDPATGTFVLPFEYRLPTDAELQKCGSGAKGQDAVIVESVPKILDAVPAADLRGELARVVEVRNPDDPKKREETTCLARRLRHFTKRNTTDYFIHKDLGGFLRRELEFYVKDHVVHAADLEGDFEAKRRMLRVFRALAEQVVAFLAQIEDVQKRLFEKKKFVLRTDYLVPIQNVPRAMWPEVLANKTQVAEWKDLFAIEPKKDLFNKKGEINEHFLGEHPTLVVNTAHFDSGFSARLLEAFDDRDEATDGLLIHAENYQALRFLERRCASLVGCIYIDPPYNTGDSEIPYKNGYLFSSWLALMEDRLTAAMKLLTKDAILFIAIDDFELADLCQLVDKQFPFLRREMIVVNHHPQGGKAKTFAATHEYMLVCLRGDSARTLMGREGSDATERRPFKRSGTAESNFRKGRPNSFYAVLVDPKTRKVSGLEHPPEGTYPTGANKDGHVRAYPLGENGEERVWRRSYESALGLLREEKLICSEGMTIYQLIEAGDRTPALFSNWIDPRYNAGTYGANLLADIIGRHNPFAYPKSVHTVGDAIYAGGFHDGDMCLDFFGGSGTTGHAVINLNREDAEQRSFTLVEMGEHFDTVLLPRIQKIMFAPEWKGGKPVRMATREEAARTPRLVKIVRLESYEDALHNVAVAEAQGRTTKKASAIRAAAGEETYRLNYLVKLPMEASDTMLNVAALEHPFNYTIEVLTDSGPVSQTVDLVETFNWLYGLRVKRLLTWTHDGGTTSVSSPATKTDATERVPPCGRTYRVVVATDREQRRRILVVWRDMADLDPRAERKFLETKVKELGDFEEMLINGDSAVPGFCSLDGLFKRLMEEGER